MPGPSWLLTADPPPAESTPAESALYDPITARGAVRQGAPAPTLAAGRPRATPTGEIRPAMARWPAAAPTAEIDLSAAPDGPGGTRDVAEPGLSGNERMLQERMLAATAEMASEPDAAHAAPAVAQVPGTVVALPPAPAFKPLDAITTMVAETALRGALDPPGATRPPDRILPRPSLKPAVMTSEAPEPVRTRDTRAVATQGKTLPDAFRAFWTNLKILLASAPASWEMRAGSGGNGGVRTSAIASRSGGDSAPSGSGGNGSPTDDGGSSSAGGGSVGGGGGGASSGDDGGGVSSGGGGGGGSVSSGGSGGRGSSDGGRGGGGRGDRDRDDDRGSRGDDRGGRGDGDRGGRGHGRGGDDDGDDD